MKATEAAVNARPKKFMNKKTKRALFYFCVVALPLLQFIIFYVVVNFRSFLYAFQTYEGVESRFVFLDNFKRFFREMGESQDLKYSLRNSALLYFLTLIIGTGGAIVFSNYIYKKNFGKGFFRITLFLPTIVSGIVLVTAYKFVIDEGVPYIAELMHKHTEPPLSIRGTNFWIVMAFSLWFSFGSQVLMYTSTMSGISPEVVESAQLDGITPFKELIFITIPMIYSTVVTFITVGVAGFFTNQMMLYSFFGGAADPVFMTFGYWLYRETIVATELSNYNTFAYLSAVGLLMTLVAVPLTLGIKKLLERFGPTA